MNLPIYIIGGGIIGLLSARDLAMAGERVVVLERHSMGRESSWAGGGILSPLYPWRYPEPVNQLARWSQTAYPELAHALGADGQCDVEWIRSGLLVCDRTETRRAMEWAAHSGTRLDRLDASALRQLAPALSVDIDSALYFPEVAQVRNPRLLAALRHDLIGRGVVLREGVEAIGFDHAQGQLRGIRTGAGVVPAERCIVAAGAWSADIFKTTGLELPHTPVKGQMLLMHPGARLISPIVLNAGYYLIPRSDGRILVGSTQEHSGFDKSITPEARAELLAAARGTLPALATVGVERQWAGLRPGSPEGIPVIDRHPKIQGLYLCTGHFRNGLAMGPASARLLADLLLDRDPILDPAPYRFAADS